MIIIFFQFSMYQELLQTFKKHQAMWSALKKKIMHYNNLWSVKIDNWMAREVREG